MDNFANNLQVLRKSRNATQDELAADLDVDRQTISNWESGAQSPSLAMALRIASYFAVALDDLTRSKLVLTYMVSE